MQEPLNETAYGHGLVSRGKHWLLIGAGGDFNLKRQAKFFGQSRHSSPWLFFSDAKNISYLEWLDGYNKEVGILFYTGNSDLISLKLHLSDS